MNPVLALAIIIAPSCAVAVVIAFIPIHIGRRLGWWR